MSASVVVDISIHDSAVYDHYKALAPPAIAKYGGRYLVRGATTTTLEGGWAPERFVILEFPTADAAKAWWSSPEYADAKSIRQSCATTDMILVDGPAFDPRS